jgi:CRP-like cAMP-binding protein
LRPPVNPAGLVAEWKGLLERGRTSTVRTGSVLFLEGAPRHNLFLLEHGIAKLTRSTSIGRIATVGLRYPGEFLTLCCVPATRAAEYVSAIALTECTVYILPLDEVGRALRRDLRVATLILQHADHDIEALTRAVIDLTFLNASQRWEKLIRDLLPFFVWRKSNRGLHFRLPLRDREVAEILGISPQQFSAVKTRWAKREKITRTRGGEFSRIGGSRNCTRLNHHSRTRPALL